MRKNNIISFAVLTTISILYTSCSIPRFVSKTENTAVPNTFGSRQDTLNSAKIKWGQFFKDPKLIALIDTALQNNQELNIVLQEIKISENEILARKGAYLPFVSGGALTGVEKVSRYTSQGASDEITEIRPGKPTPVVLPNNLLGLNASWEVDIWRKLRNSKKSAVHNFLSTVDGKNFMVTNLIAEISNSYFELIALDNQMDLLQKNIQIQTDALAMVKLEKIAAKVTELAVRKFEAEVLKNQSLQYELKQKIIETENRINYLVGRFPQSVSRNTLAFNDQTNDDINEGIPSQMLSNRADIRQAEQKLLAAKINVKVAKADFYPSLFINASAGLQAFNPQYILTAPESLIASVAGSFIGPIINKKAIKANYLSSNSKQIQAVYNYEQSILNAHIEVVNQLSNLNNLKYNYDFKYKEVEALNQSIDISLSLFKSARADYMEVLLTQRDALTAKFELVETRMQQLNARVNIYKALGGGWN